MFDTLKRLSETDREFWCRTEQTGGDTRFTISTNDRARDGHILDVHSWKTENYLKNPVVLWNHDDSILPVGRAYDVGVEDGALKATVKWDTDQELGSNIARQYDNGFLHAVSVRFRFGQLTALASLPDDDPRQATSGWLSVGTELLEVSAVTVPSDPGALKERGLSTPRVGDLPVEDLIEWARSGMDDRLVDLLKTNTAIRRVIADIALRGGLVGEPEQRESVMDKFTDWFTNESE